MRRVLASRVLTKQSFAALYNVPEDEVLFFVAVQDVAATLAKAEQLGGTIIQQAQHVPGTSFGVFADAQGHKIGVAANS